LKHRLIGQDRALQLLDRACKCHKIAPAYLFVGAAGVGKSLAARYFSTRILTEELRKDKLELASEKVIKGNHPDLLWVEPTYLDRGKLLTPAETIAAGVKRKAPPQLRIEQIRSISEFLSRPPLEASRAVVVIEEAQTMTEAAANALLKTLEEPGRATLILIAPSPESLLPTLISRCQRVSFDRLSEENLRLVLQEKGYEKILAAPELLSIAQGSVGDAIVAYETLQDISDTLLLKLQQIPKNTLEAMTIAKEIDRELDSEVQLWLVDYLQHYYWQSQRKGAAKIVDRLEKTRQHLLSFVQPRLVWECTLHFLWQITNPRLTQ
jgi:DNA polymerase-3 subunit delta'